VAGYPSRQAARQWTGGLLLALAAGTAFAGAASAAEQETGQFVAKRACEAFQSKNRGTNPGAVTVEPGRGYAVTALNAKGGEWVQIVVPEAPVTTARWVNADCGRRVAAAEPRESTENVLALTWHPAFCEMQPRARECRGRGGERLVAHGLWPQAGDRSYCGVAAEVVALDEAGRWRDLPPVTLAPATRDAMQWAMPGAASFLDRHEWLKHGTCYGGEPDGYFADLAGLALAVEDSGVGDFLAAHTGREVDANDIRSAFDRAFGQGAGARVRVDCVDDGGRTLIDGLTVELRGEITPEADLGTLMRAAARVPEGCPAGVIDRAGQQ
jgi:ribonuclease T2